MHGYAIRGKRGVRDREEGNTHAITTMTTTTGLGGIVMGERAKVRLHISRLITQRDELLSRASHDTERRTRLQMDLVGLEEDLRQAQDNMQRAVKMMEEKEEEMNMLTSELTLLRRGLRSGHTVLLRLHRIIDRVCKYRASRTCSCLCQALRRIMAAVRMLLNMMLSCADHIPWPCASGMMGYCRKKKTGGTQRGQQSQFSDAVMDGFN